jgi:hypothetical protein
MTLFSSQSHVFWFDPVEKRTGLHPVLGNHATIKCILPDHNNEYIGYVQANEASCSILQPYFKNLRIFCLRLRSVFYLFEGLFVTGKSRPNLLSV